MSRLGEPSKNGFVGTKKNYTEKCFSRRKNVMRKTEPPPKKKKEKKRSTSTVLWRQAWNILYRKERQLRKVNEGLELIRFQGMSHSHRHYFYKVITSSRLENFFF